MSRPKTTPTISGTPDPKPLASPHLLSLTADLVSSYVSRNQVPAGDVGAVLRMFHSSLNGLSDNPTSVAQHEGKPAVPIKNSIGDDFIICLEDGKRLKMLKRYLRTRFNLSPAAYRAKWRLPADYPMVAPAYSRKRSAFAKKSGLGTIPNAMRNKAA